MENVAVTSGASGRAVARNRSHRLVHPSSSHPDAALTTSVAALVVLVAGLGFASVGHRADDVALVALAGLVVAGGWAGGRLTGAVAAVTATLTDLTFFAGRTGGVHHLQWSDAVLLTLFVVLGIAAGRTQEDLRERDLVQRVDRRSWHALGDALRTRASAAPATTGPAVLAAVAECLEAESCTFTRGRVVDLPVLRDLSGVQDVSTTFGPRGHVLRPSGMALPVRSEGDLLGHLVCWPREGAAASTDRLRAALALADLYGAIAAGAATRPTQDPDHLPPGRQQGPS